MYLPQGWKTNPTPPLTPSLAKGFMEKAPEWLIQPLPQGGSLLDFQLTISVCTGWLKYQHATQTEPCFTLG